MTVCSMMGVTTVTGTETQSKIASGASGTLVQSTGTGTLCNFTTSTYPATNAISTLLYASAANVMSALPTANSGVLTTSATGVPSIDTTNFAVLATGVQIKGNNTNTAPPAGFIGEQIRATVAQASAVSLVNLTPKTVTSIALTAGIWDISGLCSYLFSSAGTLIACSISTTTNTNGTSGDNLAFLCTAFSSVDASSISIPAFRATLSGNTTYYLVADAQFAAGTATVFGRISATRVG